MPGPDGNAASCGGAGRRSVVVAGGLCSLKRFRDSERELANFLVSHNGQQRRFPSQAEECPSAIQPTMSRAPGGGSSQKSSPPLGSEVPSVGGASQKSSQNPTTLVGAASEDSASLMSITGASAALAASTKQPTAHRGDPSLGTPLHLLVMPYQAGVALPSDIVPIPGSTPCIGDTVRPVEALVTFDLEAATAGPIAAAANAVPRPTNNATPPPADGLPGTQPGDADVELPLLIGVVRDYDDDCDNTQLPWLSRAGTAATDMKRYPCATSPAELKCADKKLNRSNSVGSLTSGQSTPPNRIPHGHLSQSLLHDVRELVLPTRRCTRDQQARRQRACLAECGRKLLEP